MYVRGQSEKGANPKRAYSSERLTSWEGPGGGFTNLYSSVNARSVISHFSGVSAFDPACWKRDTYSSHSF